MAKKSNKRYWFSVVEEMVQNPKFQNFRGGRVEVYDQKDKKAYYAIYEARFWLPQEFMDGFRELFDGKESDDMPRIGWDIERDEREKVEREKKSVMVPIDLKREFCHADKVAKSVIADATHGMRRGE